MPENQKGYYFTATNGTDTFTSPLIDLKVRNLGLMKSMAKVNPWVIDAGNGFYLSNLGRSVDGINWQACSSQLPEQFDRMFFWKGAFYGYTYYASLIDTLYRSEYGAAWTQVPIPRGMINISPMGDFLIAKDSEETYLSSTDTVEWTALDGITDVCFAGGKFFGNMEGQAVYSVDLSHWLVPSGVSGPYYSVVYAEGLWLAYSSNTNLYSRDGVNWSLLEGRYSSFAPERLAFLDGDYFALNRYETRKITPDLTVTNVGESADWVALANGQIFWQGIGTYYLGEGGLPGGTEFMALEAGEAAELLLGESFAFHVPLDQKDILSLKLYNQLGLVTERNAPPFFDPVLLPGVGSHLLSAVIQTRDGRDPVYRTTDC